ncbi:MAG: hypothetical protein IT258_09745 [Saprospiraceae bacterium]|nr:hypothetical protein [Saprospiraceae bacterium]
MTTLTEGKLQFQFDETWSELVHYDTYPDVRKSHLSCVDIMGLNGGNKVFLFEVKDFKNQRPEQHDSIVRRLLPDSQSTHDNKVSPLLKDIVGNVKDSLLFLSLQSRRKALEEAEIWVSLREKIETPSNQIYVVLWLELDKGYPNLSAREVLSAQTILESKLQQRLSWLTSNVIVTDTARHPFGESLVVKAI